jgi:cation diffusion facilitator CzcD-associated flavoprotein CzcO
MHSANWEHGMDFKDNTVAVIGGGSSAVQIIPSLQPGNSPIHQGWKYIHHGIMS